MSKGGGGNSVSTLEVAQKTRESEVRGWCSEVNVLGERFEFNYSSHNHGSGKWPPKRRLN